MGESKMKKMKENVRKLCKEKQEETTRRIAKNIFLKTFLKFFINNSNQMKSQTFL